VVSDGEIVHRDLDDMLRRHDRESRRIQGLA